MKEYDDLKPDKKKFYENLAMKKDMTNYKGFYDTDFSEVNDPMDSEPGDKKNAYKYYYYDKHGDDHYTLNKKIKITEAEEEKRKIIGGFDIRDGDKVIGSTKPTGVTYKSGDASSHYYQLGPAAKRSQTGQLVGVVDVSGGGEPVHENLRCTDY